MRISLDIDLETARALVWSLGAPSGFPMSREEIALLSELRNQIRPLVQSLDPTECYTWRVCIACSTGASAPHNQIVGICERASPGTPLYIAAAASLRERRAAAFGELAGTHGAHATNAGGGHKPTAFPSPDCPACLAAK